MSPRSLTLVAVSGLLASLAVGCSVRRIADGVYHSRKGYHVRVPGPDWEVIAASRADLELRHRTGRAGILANATCDPRIARQAPAVLTRHVLFGLRAVQMLDQGPVTLDGRAGRRTRLAAEVAGDGRQEIEAYVVADARCVWDLVYAAAPARFAEWHPAFERFVTTFAVE